MIVAEMQMQGHKHTVVNSGFIQVLQLTYQKELIKLVCDDLHSKNILNKIPEHKNLTVFKTFAYSEKEMSKMLLPLKTLRELILAYQIFSLARKWNEDLLVFLSAAPFTAPALNLMARIFSQKTLICMHGDIGVLSLNKSKLTTRVYRWVIRYFLDNRSLTYTTLLFYGQVIKDRLKVMFPELPLENTIAIDHPYEFNPYTQKAASEQIIIANIGTALLIKNSQYLFDLAAACSEYIQDKKIKFLQIGQVSSEVKSHRNNYVEMFSSEGFIAPNQFENALIESDYFIYFFKDGGYYDLCPSGTFFDALKYVRPIIAFRTEFFEYYFKKFGSIGFLCDSVSEMQELIKEIAQKGKSEMRYNDQVENLKKAQKMMDISLIREDFIRQANQF